MKDEEKIITKEDDTINLANKENEIKNLYEDDVLVENKPKQKPKKKKTEKKKIEKKPRVKKEKVKPEKKVYEYEAYEEAEIKSKKNKTVNRDINIIFGIIVAILAIIAIDIISVAKFNVGPFFAIPLHTYNDGGTKEYYGLGYKVIKYHQTQGRRDRELGTWSLKYDANPITVEDVDLSIALNDNETKTYEKYYKKFVRIISTLEDSNKQKHTVTLAYKDDGPKYSLTIKCKVVKEQTNFAKLESGKQTTILGTVRDYNSKTKTIYVSDCFVEQ